MSKETFDTSDVSLACLVNIIEGIRKKRSIERILAENVNLGHNIYLLNSAEELFRKSMIFFSSKYLQLLFHIITKGIEKNPSKIPNLALELVTLIQKYTELEDEKKKLVSRYDFRSMLIITSLSSSLGLLLGLEYSLQMPLAMSVTPIFPFINTTDLITMITISLLSVFFGSVILSVLTHTSSSKSVILKTIVALTMMSIFCIVGYHLATMLIR